MIRAYCPADHRMVLAGHRLVVGWWAAHILLAAHIPPFQYHETFSKLGKDRPPDRRTSCNKLKCKKRLYNLSRTLEPRQSEWVIPQQMGSKVTHTKWGMRLETRFMQTFLSFLRPKCCVLTFILGLGHPATHLKQDSSLWSTLVRCVIFIYDSNEIDKDDCLEILANIMQRALLSVGIFGDKSDVTVNNSFTWMILHSLQIEY